MLHMAMEQIKKYMFLVTGVAIGFESVTIVLSYMQ